jgi:dienelactone hydrolase
MVLTFVFLTVITVAFIVNSDFSNLDVETIKIPDGDHEICGLLYRPRVAASDNPLPAVVLVHGISSAKESMSSIALELARNGFVALTIDAVGHGDSGGRLWATGDLSLGALSALMFLEAQPYVDASSLGLVGHSLGAGAVRAAATAHGRVKAVVLIAGGLGGVASDPAYGVLNSTFPRNLMVAVGRQDVLFDMARLTSVELPRVFGVSQKVAPGVLYGDFASGNARMLIAPATTHLLEPLDPVIVSETVKWMVNSLKQEEARCLNTVYQYREALMLASVLLFVCLIIPVSLLVLPRGDSRILGREDGFPRGRRMALAWSFSSMVLLIPMFPLGFLLSFPPVLFGSAIAWWLLASGIVGLLLILLVMPRFSIKLSMRRILRESFTLRSALAAVGMFLILYSASFTMGLLGVRLWVFVPVFKPLNASRILLIPIFIPFFLVFFFSEGLYLHVIRMQRRGTGLLSAFLDLFETVIIVIIPYLSIMVAQYAPMFLLEFKLFSSTVGFMIEFLPLLTLQLAAAAFCSWWFHRVSSSIGAGAVFNTLMFAWVSASLFPFGAFR